LVKKIKGEQVTGHVLILGSGPDATRCLEWDLSGFSHVVAINNAWRVGPEWSVCIFPDDFPEDRRPERLRPGQQLVTSADYVPAQNRFGGVAYAGATMAFSASYWVLDALSPDVIAYLGCDMVYDRGGATHFYGEGTADPLRADPTLQSLEAKARRLQAFAAADGVALVNLSRERSRLPYPRGDAGGLSGAAIDPGDAGQVADALALEAEYSVSVPSGRVWEADLPQAKLAEIDALWLKAFPQTHHQVPRNVVPTRVVPRRVTRQRA
jgi:hypothetical protein